MRVLPYHKKSPLKSETEDAYALNASAGVYAVMDGVTPLHAYRDSDGHNGAYLAANLFKRSLETCRADDDLESVILETNRHLQELMIQAGADLSVKHELWSTCVAAVKIEPDHIRYAQLGDSLILAVYEDGLAKMVTENRVMGVSQRARIARDEARRAGKVLPDESYFEVPLHRNKANRWMANVPDGYGVANGMDTIGLHMQTGKVCSSGLSHLLLVTDGMFHPEMELTEACQRLLQVGHEKYIEEIEAAESRQQAAPDDRTSILITF